MNKNILRFILLIMVVGLLISGCQRLQKRSQDLNQNQSASATAVVPVIPTIPSQPAQAQPTQAQQASGVSAGASTFPTPQPTKAPAVLQTNSPTTSQSDQLLNELDNSLNNLTTSLNSVNTIKSIP